MWSTISWTQIRLSGWVWKLCLKTRVTRNSWSQNPDVSALCDSIRNNLAPFRELITKLNASSEIPHVSCILWPTMQTDTYMLEKHVDSWGRRRALAGIFKYGRWEREYGKSKSRMHAFFIWTLRVEHYASGYTIIETCFATYLIRRQGVKPRGPPAWFEYFMSKLVKVTWVGNDVRIWICKFLFFI